MCEGSETGGCERYKTGAECSDCGTSESSEVVACEGSKTGVSERSETGASEGSETGVWKLCEDSKNERELVPGGVKRFLAGQGDLEVVRLSSG